MQLLECIVTKPGLFNNTRLKFDNNITIIYGKNESGKTLIAKAMMDTLWGAFSGTCLLNNGAWDNLYFEILFNNAGGIYRFIKNRKDIFLIRFADGKEGNLLYEKEILKINKAEEANDSGEAFGVKLFEATKDRETSRLLNKVDLITFINISFMPELVDREINGKIDHYAIRKFLINDTSNFYLLHENISDFFHASTAADYNNSFRDEILKKDTELKKIEKKLQISDINNSKFERLFKEKKRLEEDIQKLNKELADIRIYKAKLLNIQNNLKKIADINALIDNLNKEKHAEDEKINSVFNLEERIKNQYPQFYSFDESNIKNLKKIQETYREVRDVYEEIENYYLIRSDKKNRFKNIILTINISSILILSALFGISSFAFPIQIFNEYKIHFIIGLLALSISGSVLFLVYYLLTLGMNELKNIMKKKFDVEKRMEETLQKNSIILNEYKLEAIYEYLVKYFEEYGEYSISQSELMNVKESLKEKDYIKHIDDEIERLRANERSIVKETGNLLSFLKDDSLTDINEEKINKSLQQKNIKIKALKENINQTSKLISHIEEEVGRITENKNEIIRLIEEKNMVLQSLQRLDGYKTTLEYIDHLLKEAIIKREDKQVSLLAKAALEKFHFLTDNQYFDTVNCEIIKQILMGENFDNKLNLSVLRMLSLSIKLAVTDTFDDLEINLPMIIDEPFQQMDDNRIDRFKKILHEISRKRQVVIFTHSNKYKDWGAYTEL